MNIIQTYRMSAFTRTLPATDTEGLRVSVYIPNGKPDGYFVSDPYPWDYALEPRENHALAFASFAQKVDENHDTNWNEYEYYQASNRDGFVFVAWRHIPLEEYAQQAWKGVDE